MSKGRKFLEDKGFAPSSEIKLWHLSELEITENGLSSPDCSNTSAKTHHNNYEITLTYKL